MRCGALAWRQGLLACLLTTAFVQTPLDARGQTKNGTTSTSSGSSGGRWALIVGIDEYESRDIRPLHGAVADAKAIANALIDYADFPPGQVFLLVGDGATKPTTATILDVFYELRRSVRPGDLLLVFFAGHGVEVDGRRFLVTYESRMNTSGALKASALPASDLMQELEALPVTHRIIMVDACRDDPLGRGERRPNLANGAFEAAFTLQPSDEAGIRATFLASRRGQSAYEWAEKARGFFSYFIERGLQGEAAVFGKVTVTSLAGYLNENVPQAVREQRGKEQTPFMDLRGEAFTLVREERVASSIRAGKAAPAQAATRTVYGVTKDSQGIPVAGATVTVAWSSTASRGAAIATDAAREIARIQTDEDGFFKTEVPALATVEISARSGPLVARNVTSTPSESGKKINLFLAQQGSTTESLASKSTPAVAAASPPPAAPASALPPTPTPPAPTPRLDPAQELAEVAYQHFVIESFLESETVAREALRLAPRNPLAAAVLANCLAVEAVNRRDPAKQAQARLAAAQAVFLAPDSALTNNASGLLLVAGGDLAGAQQLFARASQLSPKLGAVSANLAYTYCQQKRYKDAERAYRAAIKALPESAVPYNGLAQVLIEQKRPREAVTAVLEAISHYQLRDSYLGSFYVNLAVALFMDGKREAAMEAVARAKSLGVANNPAYDIIEMSSRTMKR